MTDKEDKANAPIDLVKKNLTSGPVCDSVMRCEEWKNNVQFFEGAAPMFIFCPFCRGRLWRKK